MRKENELVSVIPELKTRRLNMDMHPGEPPPGVGDFFVSVGKAHKVCSVYQVMSVRKVNSRINLSRFACQVCSLPELVPFAEVDEHWNAKVKEEPAIAFYWISRNKKKK